VTKFNIGKGKMSMETTSELSLFEQLGGTYTELDGILYPNIVPEKEDAVTFCGRYGEAWKSYMKENYVVQYRHLYHIGKLNDKACEVNEEVYQMLETIMEQYLKKHKPRNPNSTMEMWRLREQAKAVAEETVFRDIVYHFC
jgi:hypothetical protein